MRLVFIFLSILFIVLTGCSIGEGQEMNGDGVLINQPGVYYIERLSYSIHVEIIPKSIVYYKVLDAEEHCIIESVERFSAVQRWSLFWDQRNRLWVQSSDIGTFLWEQVQTEEYRQRPVSSDKSLIQQMPHEVFESLANSIKKRWHEYR